MIWSKIKFFFFQARTRVVLRYSGPKLSPTAMAKKKPTYLLLPAYAYTVLKFFFQLTCTVRSALCRMLWYCRAEVRNPSGFAFDCLWKLILRDIKGKYYANGAHLNTPIILYSLRAENKQGFFQRGRSVWAVVWSMIQDRRLTGWHAVLESMQQYLILSSKLVL